MSKLLGWLVAIITSIILGVTYIAPPKKVFDFNSYYKGLVSNGEPDYRTTYNAYNSIGVKSFEECSRESVRLPSNLYIYEPKGKYAFKWFWAVDEYKPKPQYLQPYHETDNPEGYILDGDCYTWYSNKQLYLLAFANSNLLASSVNADSPYPELGQTDGVRMTLTAKLPEHGKAIRITYGSMERWWCCINKDSDGDNDDRLKPRFGHTLSFSDNDTMYSGAVIGLSGWSGIPNPKTGRYYISIRIEECTIDSDGLLDNIWKSIKLEDIFDLD